MSAVKKIVCSSGELFDFFELNVEERSKFYKKYYAIQQNIERGNEKDLENFKLDLGRAIDKFKTEYSNID